MKVGYIGLGALGSQLALRFAAGHELVVWDARAEAAEPYRARGANVAASAREVAQASDVVLLCLPRSGDVRQAVFGPAGLAEGLRSGQLVIDQTSGDAAETRAIADELQALGVAMLDAAVSASPQVVGEGKAVLMAAGPDGTWQRALPVLQVITTSVHRCGARVGDGQAMKALNNAMNAGNRVGTLELVALGRKAGLTLARLTEVLNLGRGRNLTTERMLPAIAAGRASTNFGLALMVKDIDQALALGLSLGAAMPLVSATRSVFGRALSQLGPQSRLEDIIGFVEQGAGTRLADGAGDVHPRAGEAPTHDEVAALIDGAAADLAFALSCECVAAGLKYGLDLDAMDRVLGQSSGWSAALRVLLPALMQGRRLPCDPLQTAVRRHARLHDLSVCLGAPTALAGAVSGVIGAAAGRWGATIGLDALADPLRR